MVDGVLHFRNRALDVSDRVIILEIERSIRWMERSISGSRARRFRSSDDCGDEGNDVRDGAFDFGIVGSMFPIER